MTRCSWIKVRETGTDKHGQMRQPIVMKGGLKEWEFALYVYDSLQPGILVWGCKTGGGDTWGGNLGNEWHYECGTYSIKDGMKLYLDGTEKVVAQGDNVVDNVELCVKNLIDIHQEIYMQLQKDLSIDHDIHFPKSSISDIRHQVQQVILSSLQDIECGQGLYKRIEKKLSEFESNIDGPD